MTYDSYLNPDPMHAWGMSDLLLIYNRQRRFQAQSYNIQGAPDAHVGPCLKPTLRCPYKNAESWLSVGSSHSGQSGGKKAGKDAMAPSAIFSSNSTVRVRRSKVLCQKIVHPPNRTPFLDQDERSFHNPNFPVVPPRLVCRTALITGDAIN